MMILQHIKKAFDDKDDYYIQEREDDNTIVSEYKVVSDVISEEESGER